MKMSEQHYFIKSTAFSVQKRKTKKGIVYDVIFRVYDINGVESQKKLSGYATESLAKKAHTNFVTSNCTLTTERIGNKNKIIFDDAYCQYLAYAETTHRESSLYDLEHIFPKYIIPYFKGKNIAKLTKKNLFEWQDSIWQTKKEDGSPLSYAYLKKIRSIFNAFLNWCKQRYETPNPLDLIKIPKRKEAPDEMKFWEKSEFENFISCVDDVLWQTYFMVLYYTGCREGESFALSDSDFDGKNLHITKTVTTKIRSEEKYKINGRKNKKTLVLPIPKKLVVQLKVYLDWKEKNNIPNTFLFGGTKPLAGTTVRRKFDYYTGLSGNKRIRVYDLRHSYVSMLIHLGANYTVVAELIGDTKEQVIKTYGHMYASDKESVVQKINSM